MDEIDQAFPDLPATERDAMRSALEMAAVPHWCDAGILAALTGDPGAPSAERWLRLTELPVIEPYPHAGAGAGRVEETSRLAIRKRLAEDRCPDGPFVPPPSWRVRRSDRFERPR